MQKLSLLLEEMDTCSVTAQVQNNHLWQYCRGSTPIWLAVVGGNKCTLPGVIKYLELAKVLGPWTVTCHAVPEQRQAIQKVLSTA